MGNYRPERQKFHREISEVVEFYVTEDNEAKSNTLYKKTPDGNITIHNPTKYLLEYLESQGLIMQPDILVKEEFKPQDDNVKEDYVIDNSAGTVNNNIQSTVKNPTPVGNNIVTNLTKNNTVSANNNFSGTAVQNNNTNVAVTQPNYQATRQNIATPMPNQIINNNTNTNQAVNSGINYQQVQMPQNNTTNNQINNQ